MALEPIYIQIDGVYLEIENRVLNGIKIICGNAFEWIDKLPDDSIDCVVFSSPYFNQRKYYQEGLEIILDGDRDCHHEFEIIKAWRKTSKGDKPSEKSIQAGNRSVNENRPGTESYQCIKCGAWKGDFGLEPHPWLFVDHLCQLCDKLKPKLKDTGTLFVNIGDKHNDSGGAGNQYNPERLKSGIGIALPYSNKEIPRGSRLCTPELFVSKMVYEYGWIHKSNIIWAKTQPSRSSNSRNLTPAHENIYFFVKTKDYYFNQQKVPKKHPRVKGGHEFGGKKAKGYGNRTYSGNPYDATKSRFKNDTNIWVIPTSKTKYKHYATYNLELPYRCINAGCPEGGLVLDPFNGTGSTGLACILHGANYIGIDIKEEFCNTTREIIENRNQIKSFVDLKRKIKAQNHQRNLLHDLEKLYSKKNQKTLFNSLKGLQK